MRLFSPFYWKRARRFIARFGRPQLSAIVLLFVFIILATVNAADFSRRKMNNAPIPTPQTMQSKEDAWIRDHLESFSTEDKIKQLVMWGISGPISSQSGDLWKARYPGGFLITGNHTKDQIASISASILNLHLPVSPFIALDEEGGTVKRMTDDPNPGAAALRQATDEQICGVWEKTNSMLHDAGVTVNFGVIGDIGWKRDVYIFGRTFSASPSAAAKFVALSLGCHAPVIPVVKHFPGHGRTVVDSHFGIPTISITETEWETSDAIPFKTAIENNVPMIMMGHILYDKIATEPASLSPIWQKKIRDMSFERITITDNLAMLTSSGYTLSDAVEKAFLAGNDMLLIASTRMDPEAILSDLSESATSSSELMLSIDERVKRILHEKYLLLSHSVQ